MITVQLGTRVIIGLSTGTVVAVSEVTGRALKVAMDDGPTWMRPSRYTVIENEVPVPQIPFPHVPDPPVVIEVLTPAARKISEIIPDVVSGALVAYVKATGARPRLLWPEKVEEPVRKLFKKLGIQQNTAAIKPITPSPDAKSQMRSLAGEMELPFPASRQLSEELAQFGAKDSGVKNGFPYIRVSRVRFLLALVQAGVLPTGKGVSSKQPIELKRAA